ncbi:MAG: hypothetical protein ACTSU5_02425 [Promethearchaeota archaeon]
MEDIDRREFLQNLMPKVLKKGAGDVVVTEEFNVEKIIASLKKETSASTEEIKTIAGKVIQTLASMNLPVLTAPMIREIACSVMLSLGFLHYRYEYTRIGFPFADLKEILEKPDKEARIVGHITYEYNAVKKLLENREDG